MKRLTKGRNETEHRVIEREFEAILSEHRV